MKRFESIIPVCASSRDKFMRVYHTLSASDTSFVREVGKEKPQEVAGNCSGGGECHLLNTGLIASWKSTAHINLIFASHSH